MKRGAEGLKQALKQEKTRIESFESTKFNHLRTNDNSPRTLKANTFFTPHLRAPNAAGPPSKSKIVSEWAVIVNMDGKPVVSFCNYNPTRETLLHLPKNLPPSFQARIRNLESKGFRFNGVNKDILVFERLYNQNQQDWRWASRTAGVLAGSVALLTTALFVGEFLITK